MITPVNAAGRVADERLGWRMATTVLLVAAAATGSTRQSALPRPDEPIVSPPAAAPARLAAAWCGPELRCVQTAEALGWPAVPAEPLRDIDAGRWVGRSSAALLESEPEAFVTWLRDPAFRAPDGESFAHLVLRVGGWAADAGGAGWPPGRVALVVAPMTVRAMVLALIGWPAVDGHGIDVAPLDVFEVRGTPGRWRLRAGRSLTGGTGT